MGASPGQSSHSAGSSTSGDVLSDRLLLAVTLIPIICHNILIRNVSTQSSKTYKVCPNVSIQMMNIMKLLAKVPGISVSAELGGDPGKIHNFN